MNHYLIRIEHILIIVISIALLLSLWQTFKAKIWKLRQQIKVYLPRKWKPRSPRDCPSCQSGISIAVLKPNPDVIPYSERKSTRGRSKHLPSQGHACPNPECFSSAQEWSVSHFFCSVFCRLGFLHHTRSAQGAYACFWGFTFQEVALGSWLSRVWGQIPAFWSAFLSFSRFRDVGTLRPIIRNLHLLYRLFGGFTIPETALGIGVSRVCGWIPAFWFAFSSFPLL